MKKAKKGRFIVIEGGDGCGKTEQFKRLVARLKKSGYKVVEFDFPQYREPSSYFVKEYLNGHYGSAEQIGPKLGSIFYAVDRFAAGIKIRNAMANGAICVSNRYVGSNMGHQGGKIDNERKRREFFEWESELEFEILCIPRPDINIILHVPAEVAQKLVDKKPRHQRLYAHGEKRDIHEASLNHLRNAENAYLQMAKIFPKDFVKVECFEKGRLLSIDEIHEKISKIVEKIL